MLSSTFNLRAGGIIVVSWPSRDSKERRSRYRLLKYALGETTISAIIIKSSGSVQVFERAGWSRSASGAQVSTVSSE